MSEAPDLRAVEIRPDYRGTSLDGRFDNPVGVIAEWRAVRSLINFLQRTSSK